MFGNKTPFGGTSSFPSTTFGAATSPFGQTLGQNTSFGASRPLGTAFGTSSFGGAPPNTSIFNVNQTPNASIFGSAAVPTSFSQPAASTSGFGFSSANTGGGGLFGATPQQQTQSTGLFQSPNTSAFGAPKTTFSGFGATSTSGGGLFGQQQQQQVQPSTLFGQAATPSSGGGLFGNTGTSFQSAFGNAAGGPNGTTIKFIPFTGSDTMMKNGVTTSINIRHQCITVMKEYESKSLEELRHDDYLANRKGPQQNSLTSFGGAGGSTLFNAAPASGSTGLFQNQNKGLFGTNTGAFGGGTNTNSTIFGQPTQQQQPSTNIFGAKPFGSTNTTTASAFQFGSNTAGTTGLFGTNTQPKPVFGPTTPASGTGLFSTAQPTTGFGATSGGFGSGFGGNTQQSNLFGAKPGGFGTTTTTPSSFSFSNPAAGTGTTGLFAPKMNTGFGGGTTTFGPFGGGGTSTTSSLFSQTKPTTSFGAGSSLGFGTGLSSFGNNSGGMFSSAANKPGGLSLGSVSFGTGVSAFGSGGGGLGLGSTGLGLQQQNIVLGSDQSVAQLAQQQSLAQQQLLGLAHSPYGDSPLFRNVLQDTGRREEVLKPTNPAAQRALISSSQQKMSVHPSAKLKPKPLHTIGNKKTCIFDSLDEDDGSETSEMFVPRKSVKKLVLKPKSAPELMFHGSNISNSAHVGLQHSPPVVTSLPHVVTSLPSQNTGSVEKSKSHSDSQNSAEKSSPDWLINGIAKEKPPVFPLKSRSTGGGVNDTILHLNIKDVSDQDDSEKENVSQDVSTDASFENDDSEPELLDPGEPHPARITLRRAGYYTLPTLDELADMTDANGNCFLENFTIGREGFGNVFFFGVTNVAGMNLDEIVHFRKKEVTVYPDDDNKPPLNEGLNKRAQVTLDGVWPNDKTTCRSIKDPVRLKAMQYQEKLERASAKLGAKFIDYRSETGSWVFQVSHFSKYGLEDSDDEDDNTAVSKTQHDAKKQKTTAGKLVVPPSTARPPEQHPSPQDGIGHQQQQGFIPVSMQQIGGSRDSFQKTHQMPSRISTVNGEGSMLNGHRAGRTHFHDMDDDDDEMEDITQQTFPEEMLDEDATADVNNESSSHRLAMSLGVNSQRLQHMKASFFVEAATGAAAVEEDHRHEENTTERRSLLKRSSEVPDGSRSRFAINTTTTAATDRSAVNLMDTANKSAPAIVKSSQTPGVSAIFPAMRAKPADQMPMPESFARYMLLDSAGMSIARPRRVAATGRLRTRVPIERSLLHKRQRLLADMGCFMGHKFRVGWGPNWTLVHCGESVGEEPVTGDTRKHPYSNLLDFPKPKPRLDTTPYRIAVEGVNHRSKPQDRQSFKTLDIERCLEIQLENSRGVVENQCPIFVAEPGVDNFHQQAELSAKLLEGIPSSHPDVQFMSHWCHVWRLGVVLWGRIPGLELGENSTYSEQMARRRAFSAWLQSCSLAKITGEVQQNNLEDSKYIDTIFSQLSAHKISEACRVAQRSRDHRLAMALAEAAAGVQAVRLWCHQQLENWEEQKADKFVEVNRLKVLALLSGVLVWPSSTTAVNVCDGVDWKRTLALHLWYASSSVASIPDALHLYESGFNGDSAHGKYCCPPLPPYLEDDVDAQQVMEEKQFVVYDVCYHLLQLYTRRSHPLERVLCPTTSTPDQLDHRLSWLLYQGLRAVGYDHLSDFQACSLHVNFAAQLEALGLWQWAIFVLLHIPDSLRRHSVVLDVLGRHVALSGDSDREVFLHERLLIPKQWIFKAKALRAKSEGKLHDQAWYLLKAGLWNQSHDIILKHIAPDAIINENYAHLKKFLVELAPPERSATIMDWKIGGSVFLDYINLSMKLDRIVKREMDTYQLEHLQPEVTSLCNRIGSIQCHSAKDRLCQSEMSKKTIILLRAVLSAQTPDGTPIPSRLLAPYVTNLPMPEDYAFQELLELTQSYFSEITA